MGLVGWSHQSFDATKSIEGLASAADYLIENDGEHKEDVNSQRPYNQNFRSVERPSRVSLRLCGSELVMLQHGESKIVIFCGDFFQSRYFPVKVAKNPGAMTLTPKRTPAAVSKITTPVARTFAHAGLTKLPMISLSFTSM